MSPLKELKLWHRVAIVAGLTISYIGIRVGLYFNRIQFMMGYIPKIAAECVLEYSDIHKVNWLKSFTTLMSESEGKRIACHPRTKCKGYMQLAPRTSGILRKSLEKDIKDTDIYSTEYNIAGGILFLRTCYDHFSGKDWLVAVEIYNVGYGNYRDKKMRNPKHIKKWCIKYTKFKSEYKAFILF